MEKLYALEKAFTKLEEAFTLIRPFVAEDDAILYDIESAHQADIEQNKENIVKIEERLQRIEDKWHIIIQELAEIKGRLPKQ